MKYLILLLSILFIQPQAWADQFKNPNQKTHSFDDSTSDSYFEKICELSCFHISIHNFTSTAFSSSQVSKRLGLTPQHIMYSSESLYERHINQNELVDFINHYNRVFAQYFKERPELKGIFKVKLIVYSTYGAPFQYPESYAALGQDLNYTKRINTLLAKVTRCNTDSFCAYTFLAERKYLANDQTPNLDIKSFNDYYLQSPTINRYFYPKAEQKLQPFEITILYGTNGKLITKDEAKVLLEN